MSGAPWFVVVGVCFGFCLFIGGLGMVVAMFSVTPRRGELLWLAPLVAALLSAWVWLPFVLYCVHRVVLWIVGVLCGPDVMP